MSKGTTKRSIRVEDELWERAQELAAERGDNLSEVIRNMLKWWVDTRNRSNPDE